MNTKEKIDDLIDIWLDTVRRTEVGWPESSALSQFIEYRGSFQGTQKVSGLEIYVDRQKRTHQKFADIDLALAELEEKRALSILGKRLYQGLNDKNKTYTNRDRAHLVGMNLKQFENNLAAAYRELEKTLNLLEKRQKYTTHSQ
jgi:hypothetical protein|tara:strand:- start:397 stop:828 length:432 start_codon:yes stop_codon:yes gene_type:complete